MKALLLQELLLRFFDEHLRQQRQVSPHTVLAYRDTFRLLLRFLKRTYHVRPATLELGGLTPERVLAFLAHLEQHRANSVRSRNARLFEQLMAAALKPKATPEQHPDAFYHELRLCTIDGSTFSVTNTPQVKKRMRKAKSRRGRAAFPKVGVAVMVELGLHNPLAAALGAEGESEMVLAKRVLVSQPAKSLLLSDRYYGVGELLVGLSAEDQRHFLVRVKSNLKRRLLEVYPDGSALVEISRGEQTRQVREILGRVQRGGRGAGTTVHLWTSLLDWRRYPAAELLALYARRWEQEIFYKELKVDARSTPYLQSHTPLTAMQEIAALILAYAVLVDYRVKAGAVAGVGVLRISFLKTLQAVQGLWRFLDVSADLMTRLQHFEKLPRW